MSIFLNAGIVAAIAPGILVFLPTQILRKMGHDSTADFLVFDLSLGMIVQALTFVVAYVKFK
ncbi:hypothetical protein VI08_03365 [Luteibacter yeojuensis]|uniref:Uncharacterized protein n=1 Tax=Luteibacter yeojuensis TaxID=345309 RepID=A0A0F3L077_9GAMM|nr:hypothetical protein VI08_03365 [Luteibacter yeojuensis]